MTDLRKAAEMALNALKISTPVYSPHKFTQVLKALEAALAQPEQEPVAKHICNLWINPETSSYEVDRCTHPINEVIPVYTAPPRKEWVGLTDDEINKIVDLNTSDDGGFDIWCDGIAVARIVCAKLKEKNA